MENQRTDFQYIMMLSFVELAKIGTEQWADLEIIFEPFKRMAVTMQALKMIQSEAQTPPASSQLYLHLYHGRKDPEELLDDWGSDGPYFPVEWVHTVYMSELIAEPQDNPYNLTPVSFCEKDGLIYYDDVYYGDWETRTKLPDGISPTPLKDELTLPPALREEYQKRRDALKSRQRP